MPTELYTSTKTYCHDVGLSACFRQWRADSHCAKLHGYALEIKLVFAANSLDARNWVVDFGGLKPLKQILEGLFDHKCLVAQDDPQIKWFLDAANIGLLDLVIVPSTGCETFARIVFERTQKWLEENGYTPRCWLVCAEVKEHGANSAIYGVTQ